MPPFNFNDIDASYYYTKEETDAYLEAIKQTNEINKSIVSFFNSAANDLGRIKIQVMIQNLLPGALKVFSGLSDIGELSVNDILKKCGTVYTTIIESKVKRPSKLLVILKYLKIIKLSAELEEEK